MSFGQTCRACGCTDLDCRQCIKETGKPCFWVEEDLCSACVGKVKVHVRCNFQFPNDDKLNLATFDAYVMPGKEHEQLQRMCQAQIEATFFRDLIISNITYTTT
jgi:hypothetical protein